MLAEVADEIVVEQVSCRGIEPEVGLIKERDGGAAGEPDEDGDRRKLAS